MEQNEALERLASQLEDSGDYRVLRRFVSPTTYGQAPSDAKLRKLMVVDTETTGLDKRKDKIIEIGYVVVNFDAETGLIHEIIRRYSGFEDPGFPLADQIIQITGISNDDLAGKSFDDELVEADVANADLIVAHNAPFDRGFLELRLRNERGKPCCRDCALLWLKQKANTSQRWLRPAHPP